MTDLGSVCSETRLSRETFTANIAVERTIFGTFNLGIVIP